MEMEMDRERWTWTWTWTCTRQAKVKKVEKVREMRKAEIGRPYPGLRYDILDLLTYLISGRLGIPARDVTHS